MDLASILLEELKKRRQKNPRYSLRAFAKSLNIDAGTLTRVIKGDRVVKEITARQILKRLQIPDAIKDSIVSQLAVTRQTKKNQPKTDTLLPDIFETNFDKTNIYLVALLGNSPFYQRNTIHELAKRLKITVDELEHRLHVLEKAGAISITKTHLAPTSANMSTVPTASTSVKKRTLQKEFLNDAQLAIDSVPFELRDNCTLTMLIHPDDLPQIRDILKIARSKINSLSRKRERKTDLYNICTAVFPALSIAKK